MDESTKSSGSKIKPGLIVLLLVIAIVAGYLGYWIGLKNGTRTFIPASDIASELPKAKVGGVDSLITSQEAVAVGKIIKTDSGGITMEGSDGKVAAFRLASIYNIYTPSASGSAGLKTSQDTKTIKLNEKYLVHLVLQGQDFAVTSIQTLPPTTK